MASRRILFVGSFVGLLGAGWWIASSSGAVADLYQPQRIRIFIDDAGFYGPLFVMGIMAAAIVFSPLPSAPIALAAGAAYGHTWGTVYVLIGAEIGAVAAFVIARVCGREFVRRLVGDKVPQTKVNTQNGLTVVVFVTRLLPFLSFDAVSYAAGLTRLTAARFAAATLAGMIPATFLLAHFGAEMRADDWAALMIGFSIFAAVMLVSPAVVYVYRKHRAVPKGGTQ
ncbi:VTT domain-containing protein [Thalassospiraceae bacterium LMO-JJ14]|nr:VTT domain-containing protein [Thalassospiraceae bacterium LMO-JJ14]